MTDTEYVEHYIPSHDGVQLYCREYGAAHAGKGAPTVVCLPGLTRNSRDFHRLACDLSTTHRVLCLDFRGRGRSGYDPKWQNYQPPVYAQDVLTVTTAMNAPRMFVAGTSLGGMVAMILAALQPARLAGIVLNDIGPQVEASGLQRIDSYVGKLPPVRSWAEAAAQARQVHAIAMPDFTDADWLYFAQCTHRDDGAGHPLPDMDKHIGDAMRAAPAASAVDLWPLFALLTPIPTLVIRGALSDILSAETVARMQTVKPDLRTLVVANRGHAPTLDETPCRRAIRELLASVAAAS